MNEQKSFRLDSEQLRILELTVRNEVRDTVEPRVREEVGKIEHHRSQVYKAWWTVLVLGLGFLGFTTYSQIPGVVRSLMADPASGELAEVFMQGQQQFEQLSDLTIEAMAAVKSSQEQVDMLVKEVQEIGSLVGRTQSLVEHAQSLVAEASADAKKLDALKREMTSQLASSKKSALVLQRDLSALQIGVIEIAYLQYEGRNIFPNPYHERIVQKINQLLVIAIPDPTERGKLVNELQTYVRSKRQQ